VIESISQSCIRVKAVDHLNEGRRVELIVGQNLIEIGTLMKQFAELRREESHAAAEERTALNYIH
jgi:hypothetical protein